jgi:RNA polymerase sigma factor for flagellar operon FliA
MAVRSITQGRLAKTAQQNTVSRDAAGEEKLPEIVEPPYRTNLGRAKLSRAVQEVFEGELQKDRDRQVLEHLPLVKAIALRVSENLPMHVNLDDLIHAGVLGLFDAVQKYDSGKNVAFQSYAKHRIQNAILDSLRQLDWTPNSTRLRASQVEAIKQKLEFEILDKLGIDVERWNRMMLDLQRPSTLSPRVGAEQEDGAIAEERQKLLADAMKNLPERHQEVIQLYYGNDMTMGEIGKILGIAEKRVFQIHRAAIEKMAAAFGAAGVKSRDLT